MTGRPPDKQMRAAVVALATRQHTHDAAHFNREYKTVFGVSLMRDMQRLREETVAGADG